MLPETITSISPIRPRICQNGHEVECGVGGVGVGEGVAATDVGDAVILVCVGVMDGDIVEVVVGVQVGVAVCQFPSGMEILPTALAHRL